MMPAEVLSARLVHGGRSMELEMLYDPEDNEFVVLLPDGTGAVHIEQELTSYLAR